MKNMTKNEMLTEIKNVVMENGGMIKLGWVTIFVLNGELIRDIRTNAKKVKYEKAAQIQIYLNCIKDYVAKKDINMGLHMRKNDIEKVKNVLVNNGGAVTIGRIMLVVENENVFLQLSNCKKNLMDMDNAEYDKLYRYIEQENEKMKKKI